MAWIQNTQLAWLTARNLKYWHAKSRFTTYFTACAGSRLPSRQQAILRAHLCTAVHVDLATQNQDMVWGAGHLLGSSNNIVKTITAYECLSIGGALQWTGRGYWITSECWIQSVCQVIRRISLLCASAVKSEKCDNGKGFYLSERSECERLRVCVICTDQKKRTWGSN